MEEIREETQAKEGSERLSRSKSKATKDIERLIDEYLRFRRKTWKISRQEGKTEELYFQNRRHLILTGRCAKIFFIYAI